MCAVGLWPCRLMHFIYLLWCTLLTSAFFVMLSYLSFSGDGKTHYIKQQVAHSPASQTVSINEAFTPLNAITKLRTLPLNQKNCAIFFNFTMLLPGVRLLERESRYKSILLWVSADSGIWFLDIQKNVVFFTSYVFSLSTTIQLHH